MDYSIDKVCGLPACMHRILYHVTKSNILHGLELQMLGPLASSYPNYLKSHDSTVHRRPLHYF